MKYTTMVIVLVLSSFSFSQTNDDCGENIVALWNNNSFKVAKSKVINYCFNNPNCNKSISSIYLLRQEINKDSLVIFLNKLDVGFENNEYVKSLNFYCNNSQLIKGSQFYDFKFITNENKEGKISEILADKDLLIIFDGLSCIKEEGRQMWRDVYNNIDHDKMEIISFLFVDDIQKMQMQKEKFDIPWPVVSDLKSDHSPVKLLYDVQATPKHCLINKKGEIMYNEVGFNAEASSFVRSHLAKK